MKILLIYPCFLNPRLHAEEIAAVPMGLFNVAAVLKEHGYKVELLNWHAAGETSDGRIRAALSQHRPDIIGFSILHANRWGAIDIARLAKQVLPQVKIVIGGVGAAFLWEHLLSHFSEIDYVIPGEGEIPFLDLVRALEAGPGADRIAAIAGLALRTGSGIRCNPPPPLIEDLDSLPKPARWFDFQHLALTRGCPGRCTFCGSPRLWGRRVRAHSAGYLVDQLELLHGRGMNFFFISDDTFTLKPDLVLSVCREIIDRGLKITWQAISKVTAVREELLYWMRKAGCIQISYGVENGSESIRRRLCKDISLPQIRRAFELTQAHGIMARAYFIYGSPGETWQTIGETLDLIREIKPMSAIFYILTLFPGTALYDEVKGRTGFSEDIWLQRIEDILYFETDPQLDQETILAFGRRLRDTYHRMLPELAARIKLAPDPSLAAEQADFLSRLGLTFSHGDYARLQMQPSPQDTALSLFERALTLAPDHRAYWGRAMVLNGQGRRDEAREAAREGLSHFPDSPQLAQQLEQARSR